MRQVDVCKHVYYCITVNHNAATMLVMLYLTCLSLDDLTT